jgi:flagellar export protein FliJ
MPFQFSLEEVLEYRRRLEEIRQREMAEAQQRADYVERLITEAQDRRLFYREELDSKTQGKQAFAYRALYVDYLRGVDVLIEKTRTHLEELKKEVERRRQLLEYAIRQREILDEVKKEEYRQYLLEERRAETREFDEIAIRKFASVQREKNTQSKEGNA